MLYMFIRIPPPPLPSSLSPSPLPSSYSPLSTPPFLPIAIAIKESVHVGDKASKRLARGVDDLGKTEKLSTS